MSVRTDELNALRRHVRHLDGYLVTHIIMNPADCTRLERVETVVVAGKAHNIHILEHEDQPWRNFCALDEADWADSGEAVLACIQAAVDRDELSNMELTDAEMRKMNHDRQRREGFGGPPG